MSTSRGNMAVAQRGQRWEIVALVCVFLLVTGPPINNALAAPAGEQVVQGDVTFARDGSITTIHAGDNSIINYSGFDILGGETVQFIQPGELARVLNRITTAFSPWNSSMADFMVSKR